MRIVLRFEFTMCKLFTSQDIRETDGTSITAYQRVNTKICL